MTSGTAMSQFTLHNRVCMACTRVALCNETRRIAVFAEWSRGWDGGEVLDSLVLHCLGVSFFAYSVLWSARSSGLLGEGTFGVL